MKYVLFMHTNYYPNGGMNDHIGDYETLEVAQAVVNGYCDMLIKTSAYPGVAELSAQIAISDESGLKLISRFDGKWVEDIETPTIQTIAEADTYLSDSLSDYLYPERVAEREKADIEHDKEIVQKKAIEDAWSAYTQATKGDDINTINTTKARLIELGEGHVFNA
jgi:hypothetical protein